MTGGYAHKTWRLFSNQIVVAVLGVFIGAALARLLGPTKLGIIAVIMVIPQYFEKFGRLALGTSATYSISKKQLDPLEVADVLLVVSLVIGCLPLFLFPLYNEYYVTVFLKNHVVATWCFVVILVSLPGSFITNYFIGIITSYEDIETINRLRWLTSLGPALISIFLLVLTDLDVGAVIVGSALGNVVSACYVIGRLKHHHGRLPCLSWSTPCFLELLKYGLKIYLRIVISFIHYRIDLLFIMYYLDVPQVAFYKLAGSMAEKIWMLNVGSLLLITRTTSSEGSYAEGLTTRIFRNTLWGMSTLGGLLAVSCWLLIKIIYGEDFLSVAAPLQLLLPGVVMMGACTSLNKYYIGKGAVGITNYIFGTSIVVNIALNLLLIPRYGINGAAIATSLSYVASTLAMMFIFRANANISFKEFFVLDRTDLAKYREVSKRIHKNVTDKYAYLSSMIR